MRVPGAAELESRMSQERGVTSPEQRRGLGTQRLLLLAPRDPPLELQCSTECYRAHTQTQHCLIFGGLLSSVKMEPHIQGELVGNEGMTLWFHSLMPTLHPWMTVVKKHKRTTVNSTYI